MRHVPGAWRCEAQRPKAAFQRLWKVRPEGCASPCVVCFLLAVSAHLASQSLLKVAEMMAPGFKKTALPDHFQRKRIQKSDLSLSLQIEAVAARAEGFLETAELKGPGSSQKKMATYRS